MKMPICGRIKLYSIALLLFASAQVGAQDSKAIRVVSASGTGSSTDLVTRTVAAGMSKALKRPVVVESMPGASGAIAGRFVARSGADGNTLLATQTTNVFGELFMKDIGYDIRKDLAPVSLMAETRLYLLTNTNVPWKSMNELVAFARANPGKLNQGLTSPSEFVALFSAMVRLKYDVNIVDVYYKAGSPAFLQALRVKEIQLAYIVHPQVVAAHRDKYANPLATSGRQRSPAFPDVPTFAELGLPEITGIEFMMFGVAGTPGPTIERLNLSIVEALQDPETMSRFENLNVQVVASGPEALAQALAAQFSQYRIVAQKIGIQPQ